jgi:hypothetical protein
LVGGVTGGLRAEGLGWGFRVERECVKEKRLKKREKRSDSQHFKGLKRGVLRAFWDLKTENGVFFGQKSFLTQFSLFSLVCPISHYLCDIWARGRAILSTSEASSEGV